MNAEEKAIEEVIDMAKDMMADWSSGRNKQKNFVVEYVKLNFGNATEAARQAGYSSKYPDRQANLLLNNKKYSHVQDVLVELQKAFDERATELSIMSSVEIKQFLTRVARGQEREETLIGRGEGHQALTKIEVSAKDRIKAAELLGKSMKMWTDKMEFDNALPVIITGEDELED